MREHNYKEIRVLTPERLRKLCIKEHWCTIATNAQYNSLLEMCDTDNITTPIIIEITRKICEYSIIEFSETFISMVIKVLAETDTHIVEI